MRKSNSKSRLMKLYPRGKNRPLPKNASADPDRSHLLLPISQNFHFFNFTFPRTRIFCVPGDFS